MENGNQEKSSRERFGIELEPALPPGELLLERRETEQHRPLFLALARQAVRNFQIEVDPCVFLLRDVTEVHLSISCSRR